MFPNQENTFLFLFGLSLFHEDRRRLGIAKLEKLRFSFVSALAFRYLCTRYETEAYFFPIHLFVYGVSRHSTNACR